MAGDVRIENLHIGNILIVPGSAPGAIPEDLAKFLREQILAGADPKIMGENGEPVPEDTVVEPDETPTPEEQQEIDRARAEAFVMEEAERDVITRANHLRNVASHVAAARKLEGFQTNHERHPRKRERVDKKQAEELEKASISLKRACAKCIFRNNCILKEDIERWVDVHPYQEDHAGERRHGSGPVNETENRNLFLRAQREGVNEKRQVHCDPARRN